MIGASGVTVTIGGQTLLRNVQGALVLLPAGDGTTGGMAAQVSGTVDLSGLLPASVQISGDFELSINRTDAAVDETVTVGDDEIVLDLVAGPYLRVAATSVVLSIAGQTLTGNVAFEQAMDNTSGPTPTPVTVLAVTDLSLSLGGGVITLTDGHGAFVFGAGGMAGSIAGTVELDVPGVEFTGTLGLEINTGTGSVTVPEIELGGVTLDEVEIAAGLAITGDDVSLVVAGQRIRGNFAFRQTGTGATRVLTLSISDLVAFFGDDNGTPDDDTDGAGMALSGGGDLVITCDRRGRQRHRDGHPGRAARPRSPSARSR